MVQQSASQPSSLRAKVEAESRDRLNFFDLELLKVIFKHQKCLMFTKITAM
jgi:hypothetical protein